MTDLPTKSAKGSVRLRLSRKAYVRVGTSKRRRRSRPMLRQIFRKRRRSFIGLSSGDRRCFRCCNQIVVLCGQWKFKPYRQLQISRVIGTELVLQAKLEDFVIGFIGSFIINLNCKPSQFGQEFR